MTAIELIATIEASGGSLRLNETGDIRASLPEDSAPSFVRSIHAQREAILDILRRREQEKAKNFICPRCGVHFDTRIGLAAHQGYGCGNERIAQLTIKSLPSCRACGSYALYRLPEGGVVCQTCGGATA